MTDTSIEWTDKTWNPLSGCTVLSPGCTNCYAMRLADRLARMGQEKYRDTTRRSGKRAVWTGLVKLDEGALALPLAWRRPARVFVNSMSDLFHEDVPEDWIRRIWAVMQATPRHTYQVLTKRSERLASLSAQLPRLPNVWLGVSVENAEHAFRIEHLRRVTTPVRMISFEPLLGAVGPLDLAGIQWAIVGGESGPGARPLEQAWIEQIRASCRAAGTAFFFKQWGGTNKARSGRLLDGRTWDEMPSGYSATSSDLSG
jgi:protein gp37